ncbi:LacI family DNA-binding transcriptional regulator [Pseudopedobacter beijingensis]|uniref:LacI family DNA-binding transcriptional regulator n=1 Tax=Pseudopedobacter beijingensis TaxID=1207056 RepID=A0ABW4I9P2_9SPHI
MDTINIKQLAAKLNLSKSTISRAFRGHSDISEKTKKRILDMAEKLNYQPNHLASNMREQKSKTIAVIVPEIANNFFSQAIHAIEGYAKQKGYHILIYVTDDDAEKEAAYISHLSNGRADGIIMSVSGEGRKHQYLKKINQQRLPIVFFDRVYEDVKAPKVTTNDYESSFLATEHLIERGCRRIAYLVVNKKMSIGKTRMNGYMDALKKYHIPMNDHLIVDCCNTLELNRRILLEFLAEEKPDGVFASVERLAFATYYSCYELGISIPKDLKIISFSSLEIATLLNPALSTVTQPAFDLGHQAVSLLFELLEKKKNIQELKNKNIVLNSEIFKRKSTDV